MSNIIEVNHLVKEFGKKGSVFRAVDDVSFVVPKGQIFAFLGPNGAGKSTTIKMLTTLLQPTSGSLFLDGRDVVVHPNEARHAFGIVFQDPSVDDELTAYENMEMHAVLYSMDKKLYTARIEELMRLVDLWDRRDSLLREYSGGMKRRLEIARGLLHHPKVLFLDEPTLGLDPQTRNHMWEYIQNLNKKEQITVFFTTHYMEEANKVAHRIAVIDHGKIIAQGTADELKKQTGKSTLEEAFLSLTGKQIRAEEGSATANFRNHTKMWRAGRR